MKINKDDFKWILIGILVLVGIPLLLLVIPYILAELQLPKSIQNIIIISLIGLIYKISSSEK